MPDTKSFERCGGRPTIIGTIAYDGGLKIPTPIAANTAGFTSAHRLKYAARIKYKRAEAEQEL